jgi:predicted nucleic acid-binding Zn ribbon protein
MPVISACAVCQQPIRHVPATVRRTCSLACRSVYNSRNLRRRKYRPSPQAFAAKRASDKRRVEIATCGKFGPMTKREEEIFREGCKVGHRQGYHRASAWFRQVDAA